MGLHFHDLGDSQVMCLDNVQGEIKEGEYTRREVQRVFGKLSSHFEEDWRVGLLRQAAQYGQK